MGANRGQNGFTMIEMLVSMAILTVIMTGMLSFLFGTSRNWQSTQDTADAVDNARIGLNRMTRELRQASRVTAADSTSVVFVADFGSGAETITYRFEPGEGEEPGNVWRESTAAATDSVLIDNVSEVTFAYYGKDYRCDSNGDGTITYAELGSCSASPTAKIARVDINLRLFSGDAVREFVGQAWCRNCMDDSGDDDSSGDGSSA
ncbi:MAG: PilW family protein [Thermoleophilia bacterium]